MSQGLRLSVNIKKLGIQGGWTHRDYITETMQTNTNSTYNAKPNL